jgi:hypothetical protein
VVEKGGRKSEARREVLAEHWGVAKLLVDSRISLVWLAKRLRSRE